MKSPIDFTLLCDKPAGYAVHCPTEEEADLFLKWARRLYPGLCASWHKDENNYSRHESKTIYTFDHDSRGRWTQGSLLFGNISAAQSLGYTVIEFADIYSSAELNESDKNIEFLLS